MMKRTASLIAAIASGISLLAALFSGSAAAGITVGPQSNSATTSPNIIITAIVGGSTLNDLEIYNQSDSPINLAGWSFNFTIKDAATCNNGETIPPIKFPSGWLLAKDYLTFENQGTDPVAEIFSVSPTSCTNNPWISAIQILDNGDTEQAVAIPVNTAIGAGVKQKQRDNSPNSSRTITGTFSADYATLTSADISSGLYSDPPYMPPTGTAGLQIVELLPNSVSCGPTDTSLSCSDYVKLFNSSAKPIDLSQYRLRTSYGGTKSSSSNTIALNGTLEHSGYTLVNTKNDGSELSLTESGGYVWLEDAYGAQTYQPIVQYPDTSSTTKVGWAWALDGTTWQWTSAPTLTDNDFPPEDQAASTVLNVTTSTLKPCAANQYRNPLTNRCKMIVSAATLVPCKPDQERNPATNRCRSLLAASTNLTPCKPGQERNPATNRCRSVLGASTTLKPCAAGWQRNSQTNRCRKDTSAGIANVQDVKTPSTAGTSSIRWFIAAAIVLGALGYALYEWRHDAVLLLDKIKTEHLHFASKLNPLHNKKQLSKTKS
jgi:hypothetical protein